MSLLERDVVCIREMSVLQRNAHIRKRGVFTREKCLY